MASVLGQTHRVHEVLVIDDHSDPWHRGALEPLARHSSLIHLHSLSSHAGRSRARNEGLARATGEYVLFLDDDDLIDPDMIASALRGFAADGAADVVVGLGHWFGDAGPPGASLNPFWTDCAADPEGWASEWMGASASARREMERHPARALLRGAAPINAFVVRRDAIASTRFPEDLDNGEDPIFWLDLAAKGCRFRVMPEARAHVRRHPGNARPAASAFAGCTRALERAEPLGREETFLARLWFARMSWLEGRSDWWRQAVMQALHPDLLFKYGRQVLVRRVFKLWLRLSAGPDSPARTRVSPARLQSPESDPR